jgi:hypothetical protein
MSNYTIELTYTANIIKNVEANDEGEALEKARDLAEESDINEFVIVEERESRILNNLY